MFFFKQNRHSFPGLELCFKNWDERRIGDKKMELIFKQKNPRLFS